MKAKLFKKNTNNNDIQLVGIEDFLKRIMVPVSPRPEYITKLKNQLVAYSREPDASTSNLALLIFAGLISFVMVFLMGIRSMIVVIGAFGVLRQYRKEIQTKQLVPSQQN